LCADVGGGIGLWFVGCVLMLVAVLVCGLLCAEVGVGTGLWFVGCVLLLVSVLVCGLLVVC